MRIGSLVQQWRRSVPAKNKKLFKRNRKHRPKPRLQVPKITMPAINWARIITLTATAVVVVTLYSVTLWLMDRPIEAVVINGPFERVSAIQLEDALAPHVQTGFLSAELNAMRTELREIPWIANARIRRRWPGSIEVAVTEQRPAAQWGNSGLLNIDGVLFVENATHIPAELPQLVGPQGSEKQVMKMFFQIEERLEQRGLSAVSLLLDKRGAWAMQLNNGVRVRFGARFVEDRIDRFFVALDKVVQSNSANVDYVDMRYTNGFAIGWKDKSPLRVQSLEGSEPHA
jgi:cell division protein FtsQ